MKIFFPFLHAAFYCAILLLPQMGRSQANPADSPSFLDQGISLYEKKEYAQALPLLAQALREKPTSQAYYYLATCQYVTGDLQDAALNYYLMDRLRPAPQQKAFADKIKDKLTLEEQDWLEKQLRTAALPSPPPLDPSAPVSAPVASPAVPSRGVQVLAGPFGLRASLDISLLNMQDFVTEGNSLETVARYFQTYDPTITYQTSVPGFGSYVQLNPFYEMGNFELGVKFSYLLPISATYNRSNPYGYSVHFEDDFSSFSVAVAPRFYFPMGGGVQFFIETALGYQPVHMDYSITARGTSGTPSNNTYGFNMDGSTLDAGLKMGFQFMKSNHFTFSLVGGYEYARAQNLRGTYYDGAYTYMNGTPGQAVMIHDPFYNDDLIWFLPDDSSKNGFFYGSTSEYKTARPLVLDFSGVRLALDFAYWF